VFRVATEEGEVRGDSRRLVGGDVLQLAYFHQELWPLSFLGRFENT